MIDTTTQKTDSYDSITATETFDATEKSTNRPTDTNSKSSTLTDFSTETDFISMNTETTTQYPVFSTRGGDIEERTEAEVVVITSSGSSHTEPTAYRTYSTTQKSESTTVREKDTSTRSYFPAYETTNNIWYKDFDSTSTMKDITTTDNPNNKYTGETKYTSKQENLIIIYGQNDVTESATEQFTLYTQDSSIKYYPTIDSDELVQSSSTIHVESTVKPLIKHNEFSTWIPFIDNKNTKSPENQRQLNNKNTEIEKSSTHEILNKESKTTTPISINTYPPITPINIQGISQPSHSKNLYTTEYFETKKIYSPMVSTVIDSKDETTQNTMMLTDIFSKSDSLPTTQTDSGSTDSITTNVIYFPRRNETMQLDNTTKPSDIENVTYNPQLSTESSAVTITLPATRTTTISDFYTERPIVTTDINPITTSTSSIQTFSQIEKATTKITSPPNFDAITPRASHTTSALSGLENMESTTITNKFEVTLKEFEPVTEAEKNLVNTTTESISITTEQESVLLSEKKSDKSITSTQFPSKYSDYTSPEEDKINIEATTKGDISAQTLKDLETETIYSNTETVGFSDSTTLKNYEHIGKGNAYSDNETVFIDLEVTTLSSREFETETEKRPEVSTKSETNFIGTTTMASTSKSLPTVNDISLKTTTEGTYLSIEKLPTETEKTFHEVETTTHSTNTIITSSQETKMIDVELLTTTSAQKEETWFDITEKSFTATPKIMESTNAKTISTESDIEATSKDYTTTSDLFESENTKNYFITTERSIVFEKITPFTKEEAFITVTPKGPNEVSYTSDLSTLISMNTEKEKVFTSEATVLEPETTLRILKESTPFESRDIETTTVETTTDVTKLMDIESNSKTDIETETTTLTNLPYVGKENEVIKLISDVTTPRVPYFKTTLIMTTKIYEDASVQTRPTSEIPYEFTNDFEVNSDASTLETTRTEFVTQSPAFEINTSEKVSQDLDTTTKSSEIIFTSPYFRESDLPSEKSTKSSDSFPKDISTTEYLTYGISETAVNGTSKTIVSVNQDTNIYTKATSNDTLIVTTESGKNIDNITSNYYESIPTTLDVNSTKKVSSTEPRTTEPTYNDKINEITGTSITEFKSDEFTTRFISTESSETQTNPTDVDYFESTYNDIVTTSLESITTDTSQSYYPSTSSHQSSLKDEINIYTPPSSKKPYVTDSITESDIEFAASTVVYNEERKVLVVSTPDDNSKTTYVLITPTTSHNDVIIKNITTTTRYTTDSDQYTSSEPFTNIENVFTTEAYDFIKTTPKKSTILPDLSTSTDNITSRRKDVDIPAWTDSTLLTDWTSTDTNTLTTETFNYFQCKENRDCPMEKACLNGVCQDPCEMLRSQCKQNSRCKVVDHAAVCVCDDAAGNFCIRGMHLRYFCIPDRVIMYK